VVLHGMRTHTTFPPIRCDNPLFCCPVLFISLNIFVGVSASATNTLKATQIITSHQGLVDTVLFNLFSFKFLKRVRKNGGS
jgi:hypothetical protein